MALVRKSLIGSIIVILMKILTDSKTLGKTIKTFLSDKIVSKEKLTLIEYDEIVEKSCKI